MVAEGATRLKNSLFKEILPDFWTIFFCPIMADFCKLSNFWGMAAASCLVRLREVLTEIPNC